MKSFYPRLEPNLRVWHFGAELGMTKLTWLSRAETVDLLANLNNKSAQNKLENVIREANSFCLKVSCGGRNLKGSRGLFLQTQVVNDVNKNK